MKFCLNERALPSYLRENGAMEDTLINGGTARLHAQKITTLHYHKYAELGICLEGSGVNHIKNRIYRFRAGDLQYVPPYEPHLASADEGVACRWLWISLDLLALFAGEPQGRYAALLSAAQKGYSGLFAPEEHPRLAAVIYRIRDLLQNPDDFFSNACFFLSGELLCEVASIGDIDGNAAPLPRRMSGVLGQAFLYISENYGNREAMSEEKIAAKTGYSISHFRYLFKQETGITLCEFLLRTRLAAAAYLLRTTARPVLDVALDAGFGDISYFIRAFRKYYASTPKKYRIGNALP